MTDRIRRFPDEASWIAAIVAAIEAAVQEAIDRGQSVFNAALSGGTTPEPVYRALAAAPSFAALGEKIAIHLWVGDERDVGANSPQRNGKMIASAFGKSATASAWKSPPFVHLWPEGNRAGSCALYAREIENALGPSPIFDLALLGMGTDGHTAGLFSLADIEAEGDFSAKGAGEKSKDNRIAIETTAPSDPASRMTLSAPVLRQARKIMVLAKGREKAAMIDAAARGGPFPIARVAGEKAEFYYLEL